MVGCTCIRWVVPVPNNNTSCCCIVDVVSLVLSLAAPTPSSLVLVAFPNLHMRQSIPKLLLTMLILTWGHQNFTGCKFQNTRLISSFQISMESFIWELSISVDLTGVWVDLLHQKWLERLCIYLIHATPLLCFLFLELDLLRPSLTPVPPIDINGHPISINDNIFPTRSTSHLRTQ